MDDDEIDLREYWRILYERWAVIVGLVTLALLVAMIYSLRAPEFYESTVSIYPPTTVQERPNLSALLDRMPLRVGWMRLPGLGNTAIFVEVLTSKTLRDQLIKEFDLIGEYGVTTLEGARSMLAAATHIETTAGGLIKIAVQDADPQRAAALANFYVQVLDRRNRTLLNSASRRNRQFIEQRLAEVKQQLTSAEKVVKDFQVKHLLLSANQQAGAVLSATHEMQTQINAQEMKLEVMKSFLASGNPDVVKAERELDQMYKQLRWLESGELAVSGRSDTSSRGKFPGDRAYPTIEGAPGLVFEFQRLQNRLVHQQTMFTNLSIEHEAAKIAEIKDTPTIQVLDVAEPALSPVPTKTGLNMAIAGALALFFSAFLAFFLEFLGRVREGKATT